MGKSKRIANNLSILILLLGVLLRYGQFWLSFLFPSVDQEMIFLFIWSKLKNMHKSTREHVGNNPFYGFLEAKLRIIPTLSTDIKLNPFTEWCSDSS